MGTEDNPLLGRMDGTRACTRTVLSLTSRRSTLCASSPARSSDLGSSDHDRSGERSRDRSTDRSRERSHGLRWQTRFSIEGFAFDVARRGDQYPSQAAAERTKFEGGARFGEPVRDASLEDENLLRREQRRFPATSSTFPPPGRFLEVDSRVGGTGSRGRGIGEAPSARWRGSVGGPDP
jgi:hypothetical protein